MQQAQSVKGLITKVPAGKRRRRTAGSPTAPGRLTSLDRWLLKAGSGMRSTPREQTKREDSDEGPMVELDPSETGHTGIKRQNESDDAGITTVDDHLTGSATETGTEWWDRRFTGPCAARTAHAETEHRRLYQEQSVSENSHSQKWQERGAQPDFERHTKGCLLYTSPSPRDRQKSRMPSSA